MKQLMIRNLKLRSWTLILYALLLLFFPIYHLLNKDTPLYSIISGPIGLILTMICLI
ncbi:phenol-soluble modulin export ABC transporter permease subunit PmtB, partial [Staphylococcus epidermidis]